MWKKWCCLVRKGCCKIGGTRLKVQRNTRFKISNQKICIDCWKFCKQVPRSRELNALVRQFIRSSSSVRANYRASQRAKSAVDLVINLGLLRKR